MSESHGENIKGKLLFWFSLQRGYVAPKIVLFFSFAWVGHMDITIEINFCFGLICKMVVQVQRSYIHFIYMGAPCMYRKLKFFFSLLIYQFFSCILLISFQVFFWGGFYLLYLCAMERQENIMFSVKKNCLFAWIFTKPTSNLEICGYLKPYASHCYFMKGSEFTLGPHLFFVLLHCVYSYICLSLSFTFVCTPYCLLLFPFTLLLFCLFSPLLFPFALLLLLTFALLLLLIPFVLLLLLYEIMNFQKVHLNENVYTD